MKKIGIITAHSSTNYGTMLQAYATQKYFENIGFDAEIIDYQSRDQSIGKWLQKMKKSFATFSLRKYIVRLIRKKNIARRRTCFRAFYNCHMRISDRKYMTIQDLKISPPEYDIYVCGSDQIWNPYLPSTTEAYFLTFAPYGKKRLLTLRILELRI